MNAPNGNWWATIRAHFAADRRKSAILAVMMVVMLIVWGRLLFKSDPSIAAASQMEIVPELAATAGGARAARDAVVEPAIEKPTAAVNPVDVTDASREPARDLFAVSWDSFQPALTTNAADVEPGKPHGFWGRVRAAAHAESLRQRQRAENVRHQAGALVVQSTVIGREPAAMISGRLVHVGERIGDFELVEITARRVVVRKDGIRVILSMP